MMKLAEGDFVAEGDAEGGTTGAQARRHDVFISYATQDAAIADAVTTTLEGQDIRCWIAPRNVTPGAHYASEIVHAIDSARAVVLILSQDAATSPHVLREIERATSKRRPVVTLRLDQVPLSAEFEYFLNTSQWLDANGADTGRAMPKLIAAVRVAIRAPAATPGAGPTPRATARPLSARPPKRTAIIMLSVTGLAIAGFSVDRLWLSNLRVAPTAVIPATVPAPAAPRILDKSVAVLPFADMSEKKDQEFFSDGLAEEVLDRLAQIANLRVIARTSSFSFKGKQDDIPTIAAKLGVTHVLEGSVRKDGHHLRVTAQLVRAVTGDHLWSQSYDVELTDIFKVQDQIAAAVVEALKLQIVESSVAGVRTTNNPDALALLMEANYFSQRIGKENLLRSVELCRKAIELDPLYAEAWARLSINYNALNDYLPGGGYQAKAQEAAARAIDADPNNAIGHGAMAYVLLDKGDFAGARDQIHAQERDPRPEARHTNARGLYLLAMGDWASAIENYRSALRLDPISPILLSNMGSALLGGGQLADAKLTFERLISVAPQFDGSHSNLAFVIFRQGAVNLALTEAQRELNPESKRLVLVPIFRALGRVQETDAMLADIEARDGKAAPLTVAEAYALAGLRDQAFSWLDRALAVRDPALQGIRGDINLQELHTDGRFNALLSKLDLPD
jgi:TolB-like protein